jgi:fructosamine-3-kinase
VDIERVVPVGGGCINHGARLDIAGGASFFLKWNASAPPDLFEAEADGLRALRSSGGLRVPEPVARGGGSGAPSWLLMEHIEAGRPASDYGERLGRGLAALHASPDPEDGFGWHLDNWIGSLPQTNGTQRSWARFWQIHRIAPQLERARSRGYLDGAEGRVLDRVVDTIPQALADVDRGPPHLLHGDLWGGNAFASADGHPVIIDPAVYRGHGEVDLAMTELFGGFGAAFYAAYDEVRPITDAYGAYRRDLYQLYYLLVHVNLFGGQYVQSSVAAARKVAAAFAA